MAPCLSKERLDRALTDGHRMKVNLLEMSGELKDWLAKQICEGTMTTNFISDRLNIKVKCLQKWARKYKNGICNHSGGAGRPLSISSKASETLSREIRRVGYNVDDIEYEEHLNEAIRASAVEYKKDPDGVRKPSASTIARMEKKHDIRTVNAEVTTNARVEAEADIRNALTFAVMNFLMRQVAEPELTLNADATVFTVGNATSRP